MMLDTLAVAQELTAGGIDRDQAEAIANAMRRVAEQGDLVTADQFRAGLAALRTDLTGQIAEVAGQTAEQRTEIANLDTRLSAQIADVRTEIAHLDTRMSTQIADLDTRMSTQIADLRTEQRTGIAGVRAEIAALETRLVRWMVGTVLATAALTVGILRFLAG